MTLSREISAEHLKGFGEVVNEFAVLESHLETMIMFLCKGRYEVMEPLVSLISGKNKRDFLIALMKEIQRPTDEERKEFEEIIDRIRSVGDFRNLIAHQTWIQGKKPNTIKPVRISVSRTINILGDANSAEYEPKAFADEADKIRGLQKELIKFWTKLGYSSPEALVAGRPL